MEKEEKERSERGGREKGVAGDKGRGNREKGKKSWD